MTEAVDFNSFGLPLKRVGAGLLIRDGEGRVLLSTRSKDAWEIPGGMAARMRAAASAAESGRIAYLER